MPLKQHFKNGENRIVLKANNFSALRPHNEYFTGVCRHRANPKGPVMQSRALHHRSQEASPRPQMQRKCLLEARSFPFWGLSPPLL